MNKVYSPIVWENKPSVETPVNAQNLNKMDTALNEIDNRIIAQDTTKANKSELSNLVKDWNMDEKTGIITVSKHDGSKILFDLNIEKIPVGFELSEDGILTMTTDDGTEFTANIGSMIPVLQFNDSDTILVNVSGSGVNKTYSFDIRQGSITDEMLESGYLAKITTKVEESKTYSDNAENYAKLSQSYAVGGTNTRENEDTDNSKYYYEQVEAMHEDYTRGQVIGVKGNNEDDYRSGNVNLTAQNIGAAQHIDLTGQLQKYAYRKSIIALCKTSGDKIGIDSSSSGTLTFHRANGLSGNEATINFFISGSYDLNNGINVLLQIHTKNSNAYIKPCSFTYNGINYGGLDIYITDPESQNITFDGTTNFEIFGLDYYNTQNNVVLNEEVYNSLSYENITWLDNNQINGKKIVTTDDLLNYVLQTTFDTEMGHRNIKTFYAPSQINSSYTAGNFLLSYMPIYSKLEWHIALDAYEAAYANGLIPVKDVGVLTVYNGARGYAEFTTENKRYFALINFGSVTSNSDVNWKAVFTRSGGNLKGDINFIGYGKKVVYPINKNRESDFDEEYEGLTEGSNILVTTTSAGDTFTIVYCANGGTWTKRILDITPYDDGSNASGVFTGTVMSDSSIRYKENVSEITEERADLLLQLNPVEFDYKATNQHSQGLIAEEAYNILPRIVALNEDGEPDAINYIGLIPYMLKKIQMQEKVIEELKTKLDYLTY